MKRLFAVIPAAGLSLRMGMPKLLLPVQGETVLARLLMALDHPAIVERIVVVHPDDDNLRKEATRCHARVVRPEVAPPDMKTSVVHALREIETHFQPDEDDGWMLIPADHPLLNAEVVKLTVREWLRDPRRILVPLFEGKRGHPTIFSWNLRAEVTMIPPDRGIDFLLEKLTDDVKELPCNDQSILLDLDTPEDFERLKKFNQLADPRNL